MKWEFSCRPALSPFSTWTFLRINKPKTDHLYFIRGLSATTMFLYCNDTRINMFGVMCAMALRPEGSKSEGEQGVVKDSTSLKNISVVYHFICIWLRSTCWSARSLRLPSSVHILDATKEMAVNDGKEIVPSGRPSLMWSNHTRDDRCPCIHFMCEEPWKKMFVQNRQNTNTHSHDLNYKW